MDKVLVSMRNTTKMKNDVVKMGSGDSCNCRGSKGTLLIEVTFRQPFIAGSSSHVKKLARVFWLWSSLHLVLRLDRLWTRN